jgi:hypothetical protein
MRRYRPRRLPGDREPEAFSKVLEENQVDHFARISLLADEFDGLSARLRSIERRLARRIAEENQLRKSAANFESKAQAYEHVRAPFFHSVFNSRCQGSFECSLANLPGVPPV